MFLLNHSNVTFHFALLLDFEQSARSAGALRKEREALIRNRKAEFKRVDHTARALREEEVELLNEWKVRIQMTAGTHRDIDGVYNPT